MKDIIPRERIESKIFVIRGQKVIIDRDLAELYGVETKYLNRQVRRNPERFPKEYMFQLTKAEKDELVTNWHRFETLKHSSVLPFAFTEHGVAMLSSVLNSKQAIQMSIIIINTFISLRQIVATHKKLAYKIEELERKHNKHELEITTIFRVLKKMLEPPKNPPRKIGFRP